jgi:phage virion morphogenesis protein
MAGAQIAFTVDDAAVLRALDGIMFRAVHLGDAFDEIGASLLASTQQRFEDEESPEGKSWAPLAESTQRKKVTKGARRGGDHILRDKGLLFGALTYQAKATEVTIGVNRKYAAIHQFGGTEGMPPGPAAIPARPFLGISEADEREISAILLDHLTGGVR